MINKNSERQLDADWFNSILPAYNSKGEPTFLSDKGELLEGIYSGLPNEIYHNLDAYSSSLIKELAKNTPAHVLRNYFSGIDRKRTTAQVRTLDTGTLGHELILEPDDYYNRYFKLPLQTDYPNALSTAKAMSNKCVELGLKSSGLKAELSSRLLEHDDTIEIYDHIINTTLLKEAGQKAFDAATEMVADKKSSNMLRAFESEHVKSLSIKTPVDAVIWNDVERIKRTFLSHSRASLLVNDGYAELTVISRDHKTGLLLKAKFDYITRDGIASDVKTTRSASPHKFAYQCRDLRYDIQAEFYLFVARQAGIPVDLFAFIAVEYADADICELFELAKRRQEIAFDDMRDAIDTLKACLDKDEWHGYSKDNQVIVIDW